jgi:hypothetical protein
MDYLYQIKKFRKNSGNSKVTRKFQMNLKLQELSRADPAIHTYIPTRATAIHFPIIGFEF